MTQPLATQVTFRSDQFPALDGEEEQINPGIWGRRLADYLAAGLAARGLPTGPASTEDWGYYLPLAVDGFRLAVCCGHQDGDPDEFLVYTEPSSPKIRKFFRTIDATPQLTRLVDALRDILASDPAIRDVVWTEPAR